jgi:hypothetical protein
MAKSEYSVSIDELITILQADKEKGHTEVLVLGQIKNECSRVICGKKYVEEQSYADWQLERNGY